jgi:hypothetical protein
VRQLPSLPSLKFLEEHPELDLLEYLPSNTAERLVDVLFYLDQHNVIPSFYRLGRHQNFAHCICAVMIMHLRSITRSISLNTPTPRQ